jgi:RNA polymerase sigma-70 factor (ECF subfamily)
LRATKHIVKSTVDGEIKSTEAPDGEGTIEAPLSLEGSFMSATTVTSTQRHGLDSAAVQSEQDDSVLFEHLVQRHQDRLFRVAYRMTGNREDAQDLLQDAIVEAYRAFGHFRKGTFFDKWLYRIMSRTFIDRKRCQKRVRIFSLDEPLFGSGGDSPNSFDREPADPISDPAIRFDRSELDHRIQQGLDRLTPEYRLALILCDIEEFSYEEVAAFLECPIGTVRSRLHRARSQMRDHLKKTGYCA